MLSANSPNLSGLRGREAGWAIAWGAWASGIRTFLFPPQNTHAADIFAVRLWCEGGSHRSSRAWSGEEEA
jgi:hypothetical protein